VDRESARVNPTHVLSHAIRCPSLHFQVNRDLRRRCAAVSLVGDFVPGYESAVWAGVGVPKQTPTEIVEKLSKEINAALADPKLKARFADLGGTPLALSPAEFGKLIADETEKWAKVIRAANIKIP
jgi:hypothetical protein